MQFNANQRELVLKLVYYGPPLSGKTTNLLALHRRLDSALTGHLTTLDTADDRTLFFDLLPLSMNSQNGLRLKLKLYTVPGQVIHAATRRVVLAGADAVAFIADSQRSQARANNEYWHGMRAYLAESSIDADTIPTVIQFNKRDLDDIRDDDELMRVASHGAHPVYKAVAVRGEGVAETLHGLLCTTFAALDERHGIQSKYGFRVDELFATLFRGVELTRAAAVGAKSVT